MLTFHEDLTDRFIENFSDNYVCYFPDGFYKGTTDIGASYINMNTMAVVDAAPTDDYWLKFEVSEDMTFNSTIGDGNTKQKRTLVFVFVTIYWPEEKSTKILNTTLEPAFDNLFLNYSYRAGDGSEVYSQQDNPKDIIRIGRAAWKNKLNEKQLGYSFIVSHV